MHVCIICEYFYPDTMSTGALLAQLARQLHDHEGMKVDALTSRFLYRTETPPLDTRENWNGIKIRRLRGPKIKTSSNAVRSVYSLIFTLKVFVQLLRGPRYDAILVVTNPPTVPLATQWCLKWRRIPFIYLIHDLHPDLAVALQVLDNENPIARLFRVLQRRWLHTAAKTVVLGRCMRDYLISRYDLPSERIEVIPNWTDLRRQPSTSKQTPFREEHGLTGFVALYSGNLGQFQNFDAILDSAKILARRTQTEGTPQVTVVFVGGGAKEEHIKARIADEKLENVRFLPFVPAESFPDVLGAADACFITLEPGVEGLGVPSKFYNILAAGRPTVALVAPDSEIALVVEEAGCGIRVDQGEPEALAQALLNLAQDPENLEIMGQKAREWGEAHYTLPRIVAQYAEILRNAARGGK